MPTSRNIKRRSLIQCWMKKGKSECLTHEKMLTLVEKGTYVGVGWGEVQEESIRNNLRFAI